jgi:hypothetical protein
VRTAAVSGLIVIFTLILMLVRAENQILQYW